MLPIYVYDQSADDSLQANRGGGRVLQLIREWGENLDLKFVTRPSDAPFESILLIPDWYPYKKPLNWGRVARHQIQVIFDLIPHKFASHFPTGFKGDLFFTINSFLLKNCDEIWTISDHSRKDLHNILRIPAKRLKVLNLSVNRGVSSKDHSPTLPRSPLPGTFYLYVGDVNWNKNLVNLAKAIVAQPLPCIFVGRPFGKKEREALHGEPSSEWTRPYRDFLKIAEKDPRFLLHGYVSDDELLWLYQNCLANVLISYDEGFGLSYIEAAAQKIPSLLSHVEIFQETAGNTALFVDPDDPKDIANGLVKLASDREYRKELGKRAYDRYVKLFHPDIFKKRLRELLTHS